jgi:hypothetical protein
MGRISKMLLTDTGSSPTLLGYSAQTVGLTRCKGHRELRYAVPHAKLARGNRSADIGREHRPSIVLLLQGLRRRRYTFVASPSHSTQSVYKSFVHLTCVL